jgi:hypothetical protein
MGLYHVGTTQKREKPKKIIPKTVPLSQREPTLKVKHKFTFEKGKEFYKTDIDKLYHLIEVSKTITLEEVKEILGFEVAKIEDWAKVLEKKRLITVDFPPFGGIIYNINISKNNFKPEKKIGEKNE